MIEGRGLHCLVYPFDRLARLAGFRYTEFELNATIEQVISSKFGDRIVGNAQVARKVLGIDCMDKFTAV